MNGNHYNRPPPEAAPFSAGDPRRHSDGNQFPTTGFAAERQEQNNGFLNWNADNQINTTMNELESKFARFNFSHPPTLYDAGSSSSGGRNQFLSPQQQQLIDNNGAYLSHQQQQLRDMQRMRVQSAARGLVGSYMHPQFDHDYDLEWINEYLMSPNPNSSSNLYTNSQNLNGYNYNQHQLSKLHDLGVDSLWNPSTRILSNGNGNFCRSMPSYSGNDPYRCRSMAALDRTPPYFRRPSPRWSNITSLEDIKGRMFLVSRDQNGCRFLQKKLEEGNQEDIRMIINEIKDHLCELMVDQFGNYLVHKILAACDQEQITELLLLVIKDDGIFKDICVDTHGTRSVQTLLEFLTTQEQRSLTVLALRRITLPLTKSMNGHHVIQYCLKNFSVQDNMHILNEVAENCIEIALDKSGCCVLQQCVEHAEGQPKEHLISQITSNALLLAEHPYGNYVVQYILGLKIPVATANIMKELSGSFVGLSMSKYGSNVVEKFLKDDPEESQVARIIRELTSSPSFLRVLQDPYGNYVAQSAFRASRGEERMVMMKMVLARYPSLQSHPHGKRVYSCVSAHAYMI